MTQPFLEEDLIYFTKGQKCNLNVITQTPILLIIKSSQVYYVNWHKVISKEPDIFFRGALNRCALFEIQERSEKKEISFHFGLVVCVKKLNKILE